MREPAWTPGDNFELLSLVVQVLPYPHLISDIDVTSEPDAITFTWRRTRLRVSIRLGVEEVVRKGAFLGSNVSIMFAELLKLGRESR